MPTLFRGTFWQRTCVPFLTWRERGSDVQKRSYRQGDLSVWDALWLSTPQTYNLLGILLYDYSRAFTPTEVPQQPRVLLPMSECQAPSKHRRSKQGHGQVQGRKNVWSANLLFLIMHIDISRIPCTSWESSQYGMASSVERQNPFEIL